MISKQPVAAAETQVLAGVTNEMLAGMTALAAWPGVTQSGGLEATLDLGQPQTVATSLVLKANVPSTVTLTGPADLVFSALTATLTARPLVRNLADEGWGTARNAIGTAAAPKEELLLQAPARISRVGVRSGSTSVSVQFKESGQMTPEVTLTLTPATGKGNHEGFLDRTFVTDTVHLGRVGASDQVLLQSASLPARIAVAVGEDTPAQVFPSEMADGGTVTTRELAGVLNAAWRRNTAGPSATVRLRLTSMTDGMVDLALQGAWGRAGLSDVESLTLNPCQALEVELPWRGPAVGQATLHLRGTLAEQRRLQLTGGTPDFTVRVTEKLEVAQAFRLATGDAPGPGRQLTALWLHLPDLPREETHLALRLTEAVSEPPVPSDEPLTRLDVTLPADSSAYVPGGSGYWYRAAFPRPFPLDGATAGRPLFVVATGQGAGLPLSHRSEGALPGSRGRLPAAAGTAGQALVRNWMRTGHWEEQAFGRQAGLWLIDVEVLPLPAEWSNLLKAGVYKAEPVAVPLEGPGPVAAQVGPFAVSRSGEDKMKVRVLADAPGQLEAQVYVVRQVMPPPKTS